MMSRKDKYVLWRQLERIIGLLTADKQPAPYQQSSKAQEPLGGAPEKPRVLTPRIIARELIRLIAPEKQTWNPGSNPTVRSTYMVFPVDHLTYNLGFFATTTLISAAKQLCRSNAFCVLPTQFTYPLKWGALEIYDGIVVKIERESDCESAIYRVRVDVLANWPEPETKGCTVEDSTPVKDFMHERKAREREIETENRFVKIENRLSSLEGVKTEPKPDIGLTFREAWDRAEEGDSVKDMQGPIRSVSKVNGWRGAKPGHWIRAEDREARRWTVVKKPPNEIHDLSIFAFEDWINV